MDLNRFTERAQEAVAAAQSIAAAHRHQQIEPEHLFAAIYQQKDGVGRRLIERLEVPGVFVEDLERLLADRPAVTGPGVEPGKI